TPEADRYGVGSAARLQLRQQVADVRLDRLLGEEEPLSDLAVDQTVRHELQHLDLAGGRLLLELTLDSRPERDHRTRPGTATACSSRLESAAVVAIAVQDLLTLSGVHATGIGLPAGAL